MTRSILITGASAGIGAATAKVFLETGWQVGLVARRQSQLSVIAGIRPNAHVLVADVTDRTAIDDAFDRFVARTGRLDVLFNNAGSFGPTALIDEVSDEDWLQVLNVNLSGMFYAARAGFRQMRRQTPQGGRIINNGSLSAHVPRSGSVCYTTTKHAITGLTRSLSLDGRDYDIACGQIDIGNARTGLVDDLSARLQAENPGAPPMPLIDVSVVADSVYQMAQLPPEANVQFMTVMATKMPFIGRG